MIKTDIVLPVDYKTCDIKKAITERLPVAYDEIGEIVILKRTLTSLDGIFHYTATVGAQFSEEREKGLLKMKKKVSPFEQYRLELPDFRGAIRPLVVGAGPAGLFAALILAEAGARPILIERGLSVGERERKVKLFESLGILDTECNVQFGEGGAGTYSDGKLKVGGMDKYKYRVLSEFVSAGAPEDIMYSTSAHVGTDKLSTIVKRIREKINSLGGEVIFSARLTDIKIKDGRVVSASFDHLGEQREVETDTVILATGHSARDVFTLLYKKGAMLESRGFGIGMRIEHPREYVDRMVYRGEHPESVGSASYHLVTHLKNGRSVYSFCMCPGGVVVPAASEEGGVVTNGMSEYSRSADNSNAAFLVSVTPEDFGGDDPLLGIELQRKIERAAYRAAGGGYTAPVIRMEDFMKGEVTDRSGSVTPSYSRGVASVSPDEYLPDFITESLRCAIPDFEEWMHGFYHPDAPMTGCETRSTSPIRVKRDGRGVAIGIEGLYPTGEGAGYSGGIVSSARDGIIIAESILNANN